MQPSTTGSTGNSISKTLPLCNWKKNQMYLLLGKLMNMKKVINQSHFGLMFWMGIIQPTYVNHGLNVPSYSSGCILTDNPEVLHHDEPVLAGIMQHHKTLKGIWMFPVYHDWYDLVPRPGQTLTPFIQICWFLNQLLWLTMLISLNHTQSNITTIVHEKSF